MATTLGISIGVGFPQSVISAEICAMSPVRLPLTLTGGVGNQVATMDTREMMPGPYRWILTLVRMFYFRGTPNYVPVG